MGIKEDAGKMLFFIYGKYNGGRVTSSEGIKEKFKWEETQIRNAINYLVDRKYIGVIFFLGGEFSIQKIFPDAIDILENDGKFKEVFGFTPLEANKEEKKKD